MSEAIDGIVHVAHVINRLSPTGGAEVSLVQTLPHLSCHGIQNTVITLLPHVRGSRVEEARAAGADVVCLETTSLAAATVGIYRQLRLRRPQVVHTTLFDAGVAGRVAARLLGIPAAVSVVNTVYSREALGGYGRPVVRRALKTVDRGLSRLATDGVHALTTFAAAAAIDELGVPPSRVTVIPRGRDRSTLGEPSRFRRERIRRSLDIHPDADVVLTVGRQERQKAQHLLVQSFQRVLVQRPSAVLIIAGRPGGNSACLTETIEAADIPDGRVRVLGVRSDVADLLCAADVFALPSLWEGLGGVVLEAMAMETLVVAFDLPPVAEVLGDTGVLVPVADIAALADAIVTSLDDRGAATPLTAAARDRFDRTYTIERVAAEMASWYRSMS